MRKGLVKKNYKFYLLILILIFLGAGWKIFLLSLDAFPFNSDEAIVGLMARHILEGERPIFFYGQAYLGSLDAFLIAAFFRLFGVSVTGIRIVQILLYILTFISTLALAKLITGSNRAVIFCSILLAVPNVNMTLYTTVSIGGYGEALLIGNLIFITSIKIQHTFQGLIQGKKPGLIWGIAWGFLGGLGFWVHPLTLVYFVTSAFWLVYTCALKNGLGIKKKGSLFFFALAGLILGSLPILVFFIQADGIALLREITGSAVSVEGGSFFARVLSHIFNFFVFGLTVLLGMRPPWSVEWLAFPLAPVIAIAWLLVLLVWIKYGDCHKNQSSFLWALFLFPVLFFFTFIFTSFGVDPSGRYFLPLSVIGTILCSILIDCMMRRSHWILFLLPLTILSNLWGTLQCGLKPFPGITTQFDISTAIDHRYDHELIQFLEQEGETRGYTTYWISYPLAFLSDERLVFIPRLPYHDDFRYTERDNRYYPYTNLVENSQQIAYIINSNSPLSTYLRNGFEMNKVEYSEKIIGDYLIFYNLSGAIRPEDLGL